MQWRTCAGEDGLGVGRTRFDGRSIIRRSGRTQGKSKCARERWPVLDSADMSGLIDSQAMCAGRQVGHRRQATFLVHVSHSLSIRLGI
jgi:hypothetical protein